MRESVQVYATLPVGQSLWREEVFHAVKCEEVDGHAVELMLDVWVLDAINRTPLAGSALPVRPNERLNLLYTSEWVA